MDESVLTPGGIIAGVVGFRMPGGPVYPIAIHRPERPAYHPSCWRCADSGRIGPTEWCTACKQAPAGPHQRD